MEMIECADGARIGIDDDCVQVAHGMWWVPFHSWGDGSDQIDARIVTSAGDVVPGGCDIWAAEVVRAEGSDPLIAATTDAEAVWAAGAVLVCPAELFGAMSLIVPGEELTRATVTEALRRFRP